MQNLQYIQLHDSMLISYKNKKESLFYACHIQLTKKHGQLMANKIVQRIAQLEAADNPLHLPNSARFHEHEGGRKGLFSLDLLHPLRLIVFPTCKFATVRDIVSVEIYEVFNPHK